jgi:hypothetical protein
MFEEAHARSVQLGIADVAGFLREMLGPRLTALIAGTKDPSAVAHWAAGDRTPRPDPERRLRAAFQVFHLVQSVESPHVARAWFIGMNPQLDDLSPAEALAEDRLREVMAAARAFVSGG